VLAREGGVFVDPARRARGAPGRLARNDASLPLHFTTPSIQITEAGTTMAVSTASGADVTPLVRALGNIPGWTLQPRAARPRPGSTAQLLQTTAQSGSSVAWRVWAEREAVRIPSGPSPDP
jgi:hypothetical protein